MADLRALLGDKYDGTIEKVLEAIARETDYLGCGCCTSYSYNEAVERTGHDERPYMAAHDALAAVLPDLLAAAWDEGHADGLHNAHEYREHRKARNPYRPETATGRPEPALGPTNSPNPTPSATQPPTEPHSTEGA